ncbi:unnamed protein product [Gadus morhua 'NCC']
MWDLEIRWAAEASNSRAQPSFPRRAVAHGPGLSGHRCPWSSSPRASSVLDTELSHCTGSSSTSRGHGRAVVLPLEQEESGGTSLRRSSAAPVRSPLPGGCRPPHRGAPACSS